MTHARRPIGFFIAPVAISLSAAAMAHPDGRTQASVRVLNVRLLELPGLQRLFTTLTPQRTSIEEGERAGAWTDFSFLIQAVLGERLANQIQLGDPELAMMLTQLTIPVTVEVIGRDKAAYRLLGVGYSARETADVVSGRITTEALDTARQMLMVGRGPDAAANYLDRQYKRVLGGSDAVALDQHRTSVQPTNRFESVIERYAGVHGVDAAIVRAVIAVESAFDPKARSRVGAIGLMQLMPATARALRVDPLQPEQNIEGGARYLSALLRMFGRLDLALVAYNAGPGFARRYLRGEATLYGETRAYLNRVLSRIPTSR
jgi:hypothetical protein